MTLTQEELDAMFSTTPAGPLPVDEESPRASPMLIESTESSSKGTASTSPNVTVAVGTTPPTAEAAATTAARDDDNSWIETALAEEQRRPDPIAEFEWLKRASGFTAPYDHPKLGRVIAVGYYEILKDGVRRWFNCQIDGAPFFEVEALVELQRKTSGGRSFVKLLHWRDGMKVRRWCRVDGASRNAPGHDVTFIVRGHQLVRT